MYVEPTGNLVCPEYQLAKGGSLQKPEMSSARTCASGRLGPTSQLQLRRNLEERPGRSVRLGKHSWHDNSAQWLLVEVFQPCHRQT